MDKINDKKESNRKFQCVHCEEKPFTTKQNLLRHMTRKHKNVFEIEEGIATAPNIDMLNEYLENQIVSVNYQSDDDEPTPRDEYLIDLRNEYMKYQHLYTGIDNRIKWNANNADVDLNYHLKKHDHKMTYILVDLRDATLPIK